MNASTHPPATSPIKTLLAPWTGILSLRRACAHLRHARTLDVIGSAILLGLIWCALAFTTVLFMFGIEERVINGERNVLIRPIGDVFHNWKHEGITGTGGIVALVCFLVFVAGLITTSITQFPAIHRAGHIARSLSQALRSVLACGGLIVLLSASFGFFLVVTQHEIIITQPDEPPLSMAFLVLTGGLSWCIIILRISAANIQLRDAHNLALPDRCESCGYDLSHTPHDARCQECGQPASESVGDNTIRLGWPWQEKTTIRHWLHATFLVLFRPTRFYSRLHMRRDDEHHALFGRLHLIAMSSSAMLWMLLLLAKDDIESPWERFLIVGLVTLLVPIFGGLTHRAVALATTVVLLLSKRIADFRWAWIVMCYELPYLWLFCATTGSFITLGTMDSALFRNVVDATNRYLPTINNDPAGNLFMWVQLIVGLIWWRRMYKGVMAVRFNNA